MATVALQLTLCSDFFIKRQARREGLRKINEMSCYYYLYENCSHTAPFFYYKQTFKCHKTHKKARSKFSSEYTVHLSPTALKSPSQYYVGSTHAAKKKKRNCSDPSHHEHKTSGGVLLCLAPWCWQQMLCGFWCVVQMVPNLYIFFLSCSFLKLGSVETEIWV